MLCRSAPFCNSEAADGDTYCAFHREILDRVKDSFGKRKPGAASIRPSANVTIKQGTPDQNTTAAYEQKIVEALKDKPLTGKDLAKACGTHGANRTYSRAKWRLRDKGVITVIPGGDQSQLALAPEQPQQSQSS